MLRRLLHVRGGVSVEVDCLCPRVRSSPRPWRCFQSPADGFVLRNVFSTSVEVFPSCFFAECRCSCLLHVRGGVSKLQVTHFSFSVSSPRPWRCFYNGPTVMALDAGLLHVRGGVSECASLIDNLLWSSPRPWRCFHARRPFSGTPEVFSTSVEVFPLSATIL